MDSVLLPWWEGDFYGPPNPDNVTHVMESIQKTYPNAEVRFATFDDWLQELGPFRSSLPVVEEEVADSWIYGVPSDPKKVGPVLSYRSMHHTYTT